MQKVKFLTVRRPTKEAPGVATVINEVTKDGVTESVILGRIERAYGSTDNVAFLEVDGADARQIGVYATRSQAGHALQRAMKEAMAKVAPAETTTNEVPAVDSQQAGERLVTMDEALEALGIPSRDALRKRISRGTIQTREVDGATMVVLS